MVRHGGAIGGLATQQQLEEAFREACYFKCLGIGNILLTCMDHERATRLCWNITRRAIDGFDLEMLQTIFCLDAWACARSPISRALVDNFFPMLNLAGEPFTSTHELRDMLKMWQKLINESAGLKQVDNEDAGVLHYLARNGAAQYARSPGRSLVRAREKTDWISSEDDTADSPCKLMGTI